MKSPTNEKLGDPICSRFPPDLEKRLLEEAQKQRRSVAQIVRLAVEKALALEEENGSRKGR